MMNNVISSTICASCIHRKIGGSNPDIWYNNFCGAIEKEKVVDPVTGKEGYRHKNDLGMEYISDQKHPFCRDINKGFCEYFEISG